MKRVFVTALGAVTPMATYDSHTYQDINPYVANNSHGVSCELIRSLPYDGKGMMSQQTKLVMKSLELALSSSPELGASTKMAAPIYVGGGPISLEARTIQSLIKFLTADGDTRLDYKKLSENIERLPPLDGIKMLSTAPTHFYAKETGVNGPGQPIFNGSNSGLSALCLAFESIAYGKNDMAIVASGDAPLAEHTMPYLQQHSNHPDSQFIEAAVTFILKSKQGLSSDDMVICEIVDSVLSTLPQNWSREHLEEHYKIMDVRLDDGVRIISSSAGYDSVGEVGFLNSDKFGPHASTALLDILIGLKSPLKSGNNQFIVTNTGRSGHAASAHIRR